MFGASKKLAAAVIFAGLLSGILAGGFYGLIYDLPEINRLKQFKPSSVSQVYSADHRVISRFYLEKRFPVAIGEIPKTLINALIVTEDRTFFSHAGVNLKAIVRAVVHDIKAGKFKQGASTLTQQLAKTLFLSPEKSIVRKIREAILAIQIERRYTKNEILELYLNQIYMGSGAYGVEAAARTYFNTSVGGLTLGQAALIAGLPKAPSVYSPLNNPERGRQRRNIVLKIMMDQGLISKKQYHAARDEPVTEPPKVPETNPAPYFTAYIKNQMDGLLKDRAPGSGGLSIYTTLNYKLQKIAEESVARHLAELEQRMLKNRIPSPRPQAALIALDVHTGAIRAMVGGRNFQNSEYNRTIQARRQPGSAFKPLVYAAALEKGYEQNSTLLDAPVSYSRPGGKTWRVKNFSRSYKGEMTFRSALALSKNTPVVRLAQILGPENIIAFARKAGIKSPLQPYLSISLGTAEVSLLELTSAYTSFANRGIRVQPHAIEKIMAREGQVIFSHMPKKESVTDRITAALICDMLRAVVHEGTGKKASHIKKDIGGKTGTTDKYKDALFIGFSPDTACGVWVGNDDATTLGRYETGAKAALPIWIDYMQAFLSERPFQYFDIPDGTDMIDIRSGPGTARALIRTTPKRAPRHH